MSISVLDLFKIGVGPSSSHTVGPMRAAHEFVVELQQRTALDAVRRIEVKLYGSLSATGVGHATDRAVIAGLMGASPDEVDPDFLVAAVDAVRIDGALPLPGGVVEATRERYIEAYERISGRRFSDWIGDPA